MRFSGLSKFATLIKKLCNWYAVVYTGFCVCGGVPGAWGGTFFIGEIKNFAFFKLENFQKMLKNQWKIYNFLRILKEILRFFEKFYRNFRENLGKKFRKSWKYGFVGGPGAEPPEASENYKKLVEKSLETCKILKIFMNF